MKTDNLTEDQTQMINRINALHEKWVVSTKERIKTLPDGEEKNNLLKWVIDNENIVN